MIPMIFQRAVGVFLFLIVFAWSHSEASFGAKHGFAKHDNDMQWTTGLHAGIPLFKTGIIAEGEVLGWYKNLNQSGYLNLQPDLGAAYDFHRLLFKKGSKNPFHPYIRAGLSWALEIDINQTNPKFEHSPGFYAGGGLNFKLPLVMFGLEANYNLIELDYTNTDQHWTILATAAIHL